MGYRSGPSPPPPKKAPASPLWMAVAITTLLLTGLVVVVTNSVGLLPRRHCCLRPTRRGVRLPCARTTIQEQPACPHPPASEEGAREPALDGRRDHHAPADRIGRGRDQLRGPAATATLLLTSDSTWREITLRPDHNPRTTGLPTPPRLRRRRPRARSGWPSRSPRSC